MKRYKKSTMNTQEREVFHIPAAWALSILRCTTGKGADFLFGQCTDFWLTENGGLTIGIRAPSYGDDGLTGR
jgi:hypothetical protein